MLCSQSVIIAACAWERETDTSVGGVLFQLVTVWTVDDNYLMHRLVVGVNSMIIWPPTVTQSMDSYILAGVHAQSLGYTV